MNISLVDGKLSFPTITAEETIRKIYSKLRIDLLDGNIMHYRPVAFTMEGSMLTDVQSNVAKISSFGYSFSELSFILNNIIVSEKRGVMPQSLQAAASLGKLKSDCSFITLMGDTIGTEEPESMFYCGEGTTSNPKMLLSDLSIFRKLKKPVAITVILMKGKGRKDFSDNQRLVFNTGYKSMRTVYTLCDYFSIKEYTGGPYIQLNYLENINEDILKDILSDYFDQEDIQNDQI